MTPFLTMSSTFSYNIVYFIFNSWVFISWKKSLYNWISVIFDAYFLNSFIWHKLSFNCLKLDISTWRHYYFVILVSKIQIPVGQIEKQFWYMCSKEPTWLFFFFGKQVIRLSVCIFSCIWQDCNQKPSMHMQLTPPYLY